MTFTRCYFHPKNLKGVLDLTVYDAGITFKRTEMEFFLRKVRIGDLVISVPEAYKGATGLFCPGQFHCSGKIIMKGISAFSSGLNLTEI